MASGAAKLENWTYTQASVPQPVSRWRSTGLFPATYYRVAGREAVHSAPLGADCSVDDDRFTSAYVDANGYFEVRGVEPGRYVVGLGIRSGAGYFSDVPTPVYYPDVPTKEQATIIQLGRAEKRANIDFKLPPMSSNLWDRLRRFVDVIRRSRP